MVPFLCDAYDDLLRRLTKIFNLRSTVDNLGTPYSLQKFCVTNKDTHLPFKQTRLPTAVKALIKKCEWLGDQNNKLRKGCRLFLIAMIEKLQDRLPLKSAIVRYSSCLPPHNMINHKDLYILKFEKLVERLYKNSSIESVEADNSKNEFPNFLTLAKQHRERI